MSKFLQDLMASVKFWINGEAKDDIRRRPWNRVISVFVCFLVIIGFGVLSIYRSSNQSTEIARKYLLINVANEDLQLEAIRAESAIRSYRSSGQLEYLDEYRQARIRITELTKQISDSVKLAADPGLTQIVSELTETLNLWTTLADQVGVPSQPGRTEVSQTLGDQLIKFVITRSGEVSAFLTRGEGESAVNAEQVRTQTITVSVGAFVVALILVALMILIHFLNTNSSLVKTKKEIDSPAGVHSQNSRSTTPEITVMAADDDPELLDLLGDVLRRHHFTVIAAANGVECLEAIEAQMPNAAVLDVQMPLMSGIEVLRAMRQNERLKDIPVVLISGRIESFALKDIGDLGLVRCVSKPFTIENLLLNVDEVLEAVKTSTSL